jgi:cell division GTPase FtsZ
MVDEYISEVDMVFFMIVMGGVTITRGAPMTMGISNSLDIFTIENFTIFHHFEGKRLVVQENEIFFTLRDKIETLIIILSDKLITTVS